MKYLLDTCVVSELVKPEPNAQVIQWLNARNETLLCLSVLTLGELYKGISKLREIRKKERLWAWLHDELRPRFGNRILDIDTDIIMAWGRLSGESERLGNTLPVVDSLIAATALVHGLIVITRNTSDMTRCSAQVENPWD